MDEHVGDNNKKRFDDFGIVGHIRKSVYGPANCLPPRMRRYRIMNQSEYAAYYKSVVKSGGYDVDWRSGSLPGGILPVQPSSCEWGPSEKMAQFAAIKQAENGGIALEYRQLVKVNMQAVRGIMYYLTFIAYDTTDGREKKYKAKVMLDARDQSLHLMEFKVDNDPNKPVGKMRKEVLDVLEKKSAFRKKNPLLFSDLAPRPPTPDHSGERKVHGVYLAPKKGVIRAIAFRMLLKEMRTQNPSWKYAKVRKAASRKWKSFIVNEMRPYFNKAYQEFNRKAYELWKQGHVVKGCEVVFGERE